MLVKMSYILLNLLIKIKIKIKIFICKRKITNPFESIAAFQGKNKFTYLHKEAYKKKLKYT